MKRTGITSTWIFPAPAALAAAGLAGTGWGQEEKKPGMPAAPDPSAAVAEEVASAESRDGTGARRRAQREMAELEARYAESRAAALRRVLALYADELAALEKSLAAAGDAAGAAKARAEHDRVKPALGLPAVPEKDADEFAAFEDPPPPETTLPAPPAVPPGDLEAVLKTLMPPSGEAVPGKAGPGETAGPAEAAGTDPEPAPAGGKYRRVLRMPNAKLQGSHDPVYPYVYWTPKRTASWTLNDLTPGPYRLVLRYAADEKDGGGKITVAFGEGKAEVDLPATGGWKRRREVELGIFQVTGNRADLVLTAAPSSAYLMDLNAVLVQRADRKP